VSAPADPARRRPVAAVFDRAADQYDDIEPRVFAPLGGQLVAGAGLLVGADVLDVAAGTGAVYLAAAPVARRAVAVDIAPAMLTRLRGLARRQGLPDPELHVMDAASLAFPGGSFDAVFCGFGLSFCRRPARALAEFRRVLRPGGVVAVSAWDAAEDPRWTWLVHLAGRRSEGAIAGELAGDAALAHALRAAGFADVEVGRHAVDLRYTDAANWLRWSWSHGFRAVLERLSPDGLELLVQVAGPWVEAAREADGVCHRRLTALFGYGRADARPTSPRGADPAVRRRRYGDDRPVARPVVA
jgi:ubiquinone/menaquinone biosynthesis C-methylase UbiE